MPKAIISNRIYMDNPGEELTKKICETLTYRIKKDSFKPKDNKKAYFSQVETIKNYKVLPKGILSVPQGRSDLIPEGYEIVDKRVQYEVPFPNPKYALREDQQVVYNEIEDTAFINALVGWGKTFTALWLAFKFQQKTLVITHTASLRDQWIEEVEVLYGCKPGIIGGGKLDHEDHFVTVANIQTLVKHADSLAKEFGLIILDEAHHCPATTFSDTLDKFYARYRIALSGTMQRKDGKHILFQDYFGSHVIKPPQSNTLIPRVVTVQSGIHINAQESWTTAITNLINNEEYQKLIASMCAVQMAKGHQVLVLADRVDFLKTIQELVGEQDCTIVTGESSKEDRDLAKEQLLAREKMCIAGSRQIFSEGISINSLSCVILAVPISNDSLLEQIIGRIQRKHPDKLDPVVIDIQFMGSTGRKQNNERLSLYLNKGWAITKL